MKRSDGMNPMPTNPGGYPHPATIAAYPPNQPQATYSIYSNYPSESQQPYHPNKMQQPYKTDLYLHSKQSELDQNVPPKKSKDSTGQPKCLDFTNQSIRRGFIRKVFGILSVKHCQCVTKESSQIYSILGAIDYNVWYCAMVLSS